MKESVQHRWVRAVVRCAVMLPLAASPYLATIVAAPAASSAPVRGAVSTTTNTVVDGDGHCNNGNEAINCNQYDGKKHVWLSGLPGSGKVNTAYVLERKLFDLGHSAHVLVPEGHPIPAVAVASKALTDASLIAICALLPCLAGQRAGAHQGGQGALRRGVRRHGREALPRAQARRRSVAQRSDG